ncbi:hypothetical protein L861_07200 [Litchfieldella anticariensis FP35 = DSM 16096]|uniref:Lipoprotein n=1 Tax=Litchfieldella anticariensis (strain DSM 16096 / CECT 5854 / CIP 108499 / LMG 22089 / FP35) TaxID=1121939 RepID=S2KEI9_LITA3|nr:YbaY family lipoprotein [Halomonas anticariensis]EPC00275.1 hypothetical protein L861_07200 [Halomonas anticariensis FP35 = DSM 16096]
MIPPRTLSLLPLLMVLALLSACASSPRFATLDAQVVADSPFELPDNAELRVTLEDLSETTVIAVSTYTRLQSVPVPVSLRYDANAIDEDHAYALRARVRANGRSTHINREPVPVLTGNASEGAIEIPLEATHR